MINKTTVILISLLIAFPASYVMATPLSYRESAPPLPMMFRTIKVRMKNPHYEEHQRRMALAEEMQIEREIRQIERQERRQTVRATKALHKEIYSLKPTVVVLDRDFNPKLIVNRLFVHRLLNPDTWDKG